MGGSNRRTGGADPCSSFIYSTENPSKKPRLAGRHFFTLALTPRSLGDLPKFPYVGNERATVFAYRHGCRVVWESERECFTNPREDDERRAIKDQSRRSRHRAAFTLGNAECDWLMMTTLTWHDIPPAERVKADLDTFRRAWRKKWQEPLDAWIMEIQERGAPHFHLFHAAGTSFATTAEASPSRDVVRKGKRTRILCGNVSKWISREWLAATGETDDSDALAFCDGGITEFFRTPDAAGRYVAKESCGEKRRQKILPDIYEKGLGRWWWLHKRWYPRCRGVFSADLRNWPWMEPVSFVWDMGHLVEVAHASGRNVRPKKRRTWKNWTPP